MARDWIFILAGVGCTTMVAIIGWWIFSILSGRPMPAVKGPERDNDGSIVRRCRKCNYNIRGIVGRCPECGAFNVERATYLQSLQADWLETPIDPRSPAAEEGQELLPRAASNVSWSFRSTQSANVIEYELTNRMRRIDVVEEMTMPIALVKEATVDSKGQVHLNGLPLIPGERVQVFVIRQSAPSTANRYPLHGQPVQYHSPFEPAIEPDAWEANA